jgi:hypothetical protein
MIKNVYTNGPYITKTDNQATNYMNNYSGAQGLGNMRFNTTTQSVEVYDGMMWQPMQMGTVSLSLTPDAVAAIAWASQQRHDEMKIKELADKHPAVADQLAAVQEAEEKLRMVTLLVQT